jgi:hypothetical protein
MRTSGNMMEQSISTAHWGTSQLAVSSMTPAHTVSLGLGRYSIIDIWSISDQQHG